MNTIRVAVSIVLSLVCISTLAQVASKQNETISSSTGDSQLRNLINVNGTLFFAAKDSSHGIELWKSNGSAQGTLMVKDIFPGAPSSSPSSFINLNGVLFFIANNGKNGIELWKSDGTESGTVLIKDIYEGKGSSSPSYITNLNGVLYFSASDSVHSTELWRSDGTSKGTTLVKDINLEPRTITLFSPLSTITPESLQATREPSSGKKAMEFTPAPSAPRRQGLPGKRAVSYPNDKK